LDKGAAAGRAAIAKKGEVITLSNAEKQRWVEAAMPLREKWLSDMEAKGHRNVREMLESALRMAEEMSR
jgi:hypothetical protein